jgi:hypothetical protein
MEGDFLSFLYFMRIEKIDEKKKMNMKIHHERNGKKKKECVLDRESIENKVSC